jgi:hypothetical protein
MLADNAAILHDRYGGHARRAPAENGAVPRNAEREAERKRCAREAARRRQAVTVLQISEATCRYAAAQLANGASPAEARQTALFVAGELEQAAASLRRAVHFKPGERRVLARQLRGLGWPVRQIAALTGVTERAVWYYLAPGPVSEHARTGLASGSEKQRFTS